MDHSSLEYSGSKDRAQYAVLHAEGLILNPRALHAVKAGERIGLK